MFGKCKGMGDTGIHVSYLNDILDLEILVSFFFSL